MGIGQGEAATTPLQMANLLAIIANRGYYIKPHIIRAIGTKDNYSDRFTEKIDAKISSQYYIPVIQGMEMAVLSGTAVSAQIPGIRGAGKTGTAQNPHGRDHSVFACFAPIEKPQIVVFVLIENGGWGSVVAAPIASLIMELYLTGEVKRKDLETNIIAMSLM
jgi:penicillin-binding protein 2